MRLPHQTAHHDTHAGLSERCVNAQQEPLSAVEASLDSKSSEQRYRIRLLQHCDSSFHRLSAFPSQGFVYQSRLAPATIEAYDELDMSVTGVLLRKVVLE